MNIEEFNQKYFNFKDIEKIEMVCDHPNHIPKAEVILIGKQPAKRNILKNSGKEFICRKCFMIHKNPMNSKSENRQTDEIIDVVCPCPDHMGNVIRQMKKKNYYGSLEVPYLQLCGSCVQLNKVMSEEQKEKIRLSLTGIKRSDEFKEKISKYMKNNPDGIARATKNLFENHCTTGMLGKKHSEEVKQKMSESHLGKEFTDNHCNNISIGRKKMLADTGGFTKEHREKISKSTIKQYQSGFEPKLHHVKGWHLSSKAGKVYFRSSYEKKAYIKLDEDDDVKNYKTEFVSTEYFNPEKQINSSYLIDLFIEYIDESKKLVEIKPEKWLEDRIIKLKIEAGISKAKEMNVPFEVWTEMNLFGHVYYKKNMQIFIEKIKSGKI
jgi:hypothetical protein